MYVHTVINNRSPYSGRHSGRDLQERKSQNRRANYTHSTKFIKKLRFPKGVIFLAAGSSEKSSRSRIGAKILATKDTQFGYGLGEKVMQTNRSARSVSSHLHHGPDSAGKRNEGTRLLITRPKEKTTCCELSAIDGVSYNYVGASVGQV